MYLLDTDTLSETKKIESGRGDRRVAAWSMATPPALCWTSTVNILELLRGIRQLERRDPAQAARLDFWFRSSIMQQFSQRILSFDLNAAQRCSGLHIPDPRPERDAMIAAIALVHGLTIVTRNVKDFVPMNVPVINPWD